MGRVKLEATAAGRRALAGIGSAVWVALASASIAAADYAGPAVAASASAPAFTFLHRTGQTRQPSASPPHKAGTQRNTSPGFWYSPQIVEDRRAPVQGAPIRPVPIPPMFPTPASPGLPSAVQPPNPGGRR